MVSREQQSSFVRAWLGLLASLVVALLSSCRGGDPYLEVVLSTDLPPAIAVKFTVRTTRLNPRRTDAGMLTDARTDASQVDVRVTDSSAQDAARDAARDAGQDARADVVVDVVVDSFSADAGVARDADSGARNQDGGLDASNADSGAIVLAIDPAVPSQEWRRNGVDGGIALPSSFVIRQPAGEREPILIEVIADTTSSDDPYLPSLSWKQYAVVTPSMNGPMVVRMLMSFRCASMVNGCGATGVEPCQVDQFCRNRGLSCGEDGQCVDPAGVLTFVPGAVSTVLPDGGCAAGQCGPWCPACPAGQSCGPSDRCVRSTASPCVDGDGDGYGEGPYCLGRDCNDQSRRSYLGAGERCDRLDNDCNGQVDEGGVCGPFTNQTCALARPINLMATGEVIAYANTAEGVAALGPTCRFGGSTSGEGKELWYAITWPGNEELDIFAERNVIDRPDPILLVFSDCSSSPMALLGCNDDIALESNFSSRVVLRSAPGAPATPRTVFAAVDSYVESSTGLIRLQIRRRPAAVATSCAAPFEVGIGGTFGGVFTGTDAHTLRCSMGARLPDEVFHVAPNVRKIYVQASTVDRMQSLTSTAREMCIPGSMDPCAVSESADFRLTILENTSSLVIVEGGRAGVPYMVNFSVTGNGI